MDLLSETEISVRRRLEAGEFVEVCGRLDILKFTDKQMVHASLIYTHLSESI